MSSSHSHADRRWTLLRTALLAAVSASVLAACASGGSHGHHPGARRVASSKPPKSNGDGAADRALRRYKVGPPYQAGGLWYVPSDQPDYDEVGVASWYGDAFDGAPTANGERFDMRAISAAHATLPMPSIVEVTNLENGRTIQVRMNDRGPFKDGRIIDLSRAAAQTLGFLNQGTAKVRVRYVGPAPLYEQAPRTVEVRNGPSALPPPRPQYAAARAAPPAPQPQTEPAPPEPVFTAAARPDPNVPTIDQWVGSAPASPVVYTPPPAADPAGANRPAAVSASAGFAVQAGAFSDRRNAERVASRLRAAGPATVRQAGQGGGLYRVVVGPWEDEADARDALRRVAELGFDEARLVRF